MSTVKRNINSSKAPPPTGPYSHMVQAGNTVYVSGVMGLDRDTGEFVCGGAGEEFREALKNLACILQEAGSCFEKIVKVTIILENMKDLCAVNSVYREFFPDDFPARTVFQAKLPMQAAVEIEAIALVGPVVAGEPAADCSSNSPERRSLVK